MASERLLPDHELSWAQAASQIPEDPQIEVSRSWKDGGMKGKHGTPLAALKVRLLTGEVR